VSTLVFNRPLKFQRYKKGKSIITHKEDYLIGFVEFNMQLFRRNRLAYCTLTIKTFKIVFHILKPRHFSSLPLYLLDSTGGIFFTTQKNGSLGAILFDKVFSNAFANCEGNKNYK
jgi:hypothetical protein